MEYIYTCPDNFIPKPEDIELENFKDLSLINSGSYGIVYRGIRKDTGETYALKLMKFDHSKGGGIPSETLREIAVLKEIEHENVVNLKDVIMAPGN